MSDPNDRSCILEGVLSRKDVNSDSTDILHCDDVVIAEWAEDIIGHCEASVWGSSSNLTVMTKEECDRKTREHPGNRWISLRYWISDPGRKEKNWAAGAATVEWGARYSDVTGYLWTDEKFEVGGQDIIGALDGSLGEYLYLELTIHRDYKAFERRSTIDAEVAK